MDSTKTDIHKKAMIKALTKSLGIISTAVKSVKVARQTHYEWYAEDEDYRRAVDEVGEIAIDFVESKLYKLINDENPTAILFYLKTKGKNRGYVERSELTGKDGKDLMPTKITIEFIDNSDDVELEDENLN